MKPILTALCAALLVSLPAVAADKKSAPPGQSRAPVTQTAPTRAVDAEMSHRHGQTVRRAAQSDDVAKPRGETIRDVAHTQRDFRRIDADGDGVVESGELTAGSDLSLNFATYDTDANGTLSRSEYDEYILASEGIDDD